MVEGDTAASLFRLMDAPPLAPHMPLTQITLNVRRNVQTPLMPVVWLGVALIAAGLAFYLERWLRRLL